LNLIPLLISSKVHCADIICNRDLLNGYLSNRSLT